MIVVTLASTVFAIYSNMFLPAWDFLPFKEGANIRAAMTAPKGVREVDSFVNVLVYKKGDKIDSFVFPKMPPDNSWTFVNRVDKLVAEGWKSPIHGFSFDKRDELDIDLKDTLLYSKGFHLLIVSAHLEDANDAAWEKVRQLAQGLANTGIQVHAVTSSSLELADKFCSDKQLPFRFRNADETLLKTVIRSNPGIMLWHDGFVLEKWSCRSVPSAEKIVKVSKKRK
jgi:triosephosphate isomerase